MATNWNIGDRIQNRWEIHKILKGGMGIVYVVYDHEFHEAFAAKTFRDEVFADNPVIADRFMQEALAWVNLDVHQNVTQARMIKNIGGKLFLFLEYVSGGDLNSWIGTPRLTKDLPQVLRFAIQFCDGMIHALSKGIKAHRDIKPKNCLITQDRILKVTDFGLAKVFDDADIGLGQAAESRMNLHNLSIGLSLTGKGAGTCTHMAPEQFDDAKHVDVRADIYSFGIMLFQMVIGRLPFVGWTWKELEHLHKTQPPPELETRNSELEAVIYTCLAKDPARRFADFGMAREQLAEIYETLTGECAPQPVTGVKLDAVQWNSKGMSLGNLGRCEEALACCDRALELNPRYAEAWSGKGTVLMDRLGSWEEALTYFDRAIEINPSFAWAWFNKGTALYMLGQYKEAFICYDRALEINPRFAEAWSNRGAVLIGLRQHKEAVTCYDRALELDPRDARAWGNKGIVLRMLGQYKEALICYDRALELDPSFAVAWSDKGTALHMLGQYKEALICYDRALELDPSFAVAWSGKGTALSGLRQHKEAVTCYDRALELDPSFAVAWSNRGAALHMLGQYKEALICYDRALELNPRFDIWINKGLTLKKLGQNEGAITCYDRALEINPRCAVAWSSKGVALGRLGQYEEEIACYDRALELDPRDAVAWYNKGIALHMLRQHKEALICYDRAIEINSHYADAWHNKGVVLYYNFQHYREALACFEEAQRLGHPQAAQAVALCRQVICPN